MSRCATSLDHRRNSYGPPNMVAYLNHYIPCLGIPTMPSFRNLVNKGFTPSGPAAFLGYPPARVFGYRTVSVFELGRIHRRCLHSYVRILTVLFTPNANRINVTRRQRRHYARFRPTHMSFPMRSRRFHLCPRDFCRIRCFNQGLSVPPRIALH